MTTLHQLTQQTNRNPYGAFLNATLTTRVEAMQVASADAFADLQHEFNLLRLTLIDVIELYNQAITLDKADPTGASTLRITAGEAMRQVAKEVQSFYRQMAETNATLRDKHDPAITYNMVLQVVQAATKVAHEYERNGELQNSENFIEALANEVHDNTSLPIGNNAKLIANDPLSQRSRTKLTAADIAREMAATIPFVPQAESA